MPAAVRTAEAIPLRSAAAPAVRLRGIGKVFGDFRALQEIDLDFPRGELTTLLGPSGCGKTTTLKIVAGLIVLSKWTRFGAYLVGLWLLAIVANLIIGFEYWDIAVRDFVMAFGAFTLGNLSAVRRTAEVPAGRRVVYEPPPPGYQPAPAGYEPAPTRP